MSILTVMTSTYCIILNFNRNFRNDFLLFCIALVLTIPYLGLCLALPFSYLCKSITFNCSYLRVKIIWNSQTKYHSPIGDSSWSSWSLNKMSLIHIHQLKPDYNADKFGVCFYLVDFFLIRCKIKTHTKYVLRIRNSLLLIAHLLTHIVIDIFYVSTLPHD